MYYPHTVKKTVRNGKTGKEETTSQSVRNCSVRDDFSKKFGKERFEKMTRTDSHFKQYREPALPKGCRYIWSHFLYLWSHCEHDINGNTIFTFRTILDYEKCMGLGFTIVEKKLLIRIGDWAKEEIFELSKN